MICKDVLWLSRFSLLPTSAIAELLDIVVIHRRDCWKCPSTNGHTLTGQSKWGKGGKEWSCQYKYDPPIWQVWKLIDKLDAGPKHW